MYNSCVQSGFHVMLLPCGPYCTQQSGVLTLGLTLREIQPRRRSKVGEHPWVAVFLKALAREDLSALTVRGYRSDLGAFFSWFEAPPEQITASDLVHFRQHLSRDRGMKPASVNRKLEAMRRFCRWAHAARKLRTDVAAGLKLKRVPRGTRPKGLAATEVQALLRAAGQSRRLLARRNYALVQLLLQAGLRGKRGGSSAHRRSGDPGTSWQSSYLREG